MPSLGPTSSSPPPVYSSGTATVTSSSSRKPIIMSSSPPGDLFTTVPLIYPSHPRLIPTPLPPVEKVRLVHPLPARSDFISAALRKPADYARIFQALRDHDRNEASKRSYSYDGYDVPIQSRYDPVRDTMMALPRADPEPTFGEKEDEAEGSTSPGLGLMHMEVKEEMEDEDDDEPVTPSAKRNKKTKKKKKGKKSVEGGQGSEAVLEDEEAEMEAAVAAIVAMDVEVDILGSAVRAKESRFGVSTLIKEVDDGDSDDDDSRTVMPADETTPKAIGGEETPKSSTPPVIAAGTIPSATVFRPPIPPFPTGSIGRKAIRTVNPPVSPLTPLPPVIVQQPPTPTLPAGGFPSSGKADLPLPPSRPVDDVPSPTIDASPSPPLPTRDEDIITSASIDPDTPYLLLDGSVLLGITVNLPANLTPPTRPPRPITPDLRPFYSPPELASPPTETSPSDSQSPASQSSTTPPPDTQQTPTASPDHPPSPELLTPADTPVAVLPFINVSSHDDEPAGRVSPTPTETDESDHSPTPPLVGLGIKGGLDPRSTSSMDDDISAAELEQLTSFAPRPEQSESFTSGPDTEEPSTYSAPITPPLTTPTLAAYTPPTIAHPIPREEPSTYSAPITPPLTAPTLTAYTPPIIAHPIPSSQLLSSLLPPNRYLSPVPTLPGSPLRNEVKSFSPSSTDCATAQAWSLYFSDSDKTRAPLRRANILAAAAQGIPTPSAVAYQDNLVPMFTADNLVDLFGSWKALRRQIAHATRRSIEPSGTEMKVGEMGLGLHHMSEDNNFHFFRKGVKPMWEDPLCAKGGKFLFAGKGELMDSIFFDFVILLLTDSLSLSCPPPVNSQSEILGISLSRRGTNTRLEVWLGGPNPPDIAWVRKVQEVFMNETKGGRADSKGEKVFDYQAFHGTTFARRDRGGGPGGGLSRTGSGAGIGSGAAPNVGGISRTGSGAGIGTAPLLGGHSRTGSGSGMSSTPSLGGHSRMGSGSGIGAAPLVGSITRTGSGAGMGAESGNGMMPSGNMAQANSGATGDIARRGSGVMSAAPESGGWGGGMSDGLRVGDSRALSVMAREGSFSGKAPSGRGGVTSGGVRLGPGVNKGGEGRMGDSGWSGPSPSPGPGPGSGGMATGGLNRPIPTGGWVIATRTESGPGHPRYNPPTPMGPEPVGRGVVGRAGQAMGVGNGLGQGGLKKAQPGDKIARTMSAGGNDLTVKKGGRELDE